MKNSIVLFLLLLIVSLSASVNAQLINLNPDPDGEPWWAGGYVITPEMQEKYDALPELTLTEKSKMTPLPYKVDNSEKMYFRSIFTQQGGSCAQASGVGYIFTYMINRERDVCATDIANLYPTHFTWNYLNKGTGEGSNTLQGWGIIEDKGCPNKLEWGGYIGGDPTKWMTGYEKYKAAMKNRVVIDAYNINVGTPEGLQTLKHWINDLGEGDTLKGGGLANFGCYMGGAVYDTLVSPSHEAGKSVVINWGDGSIGDGHAMTIVGYNDSIKYDFNGDGEFNNPEDNMAEWEIGALKVANSASVHWKNSGYIYMPYRLLARPYTEGGIWLSHVVNVVKVKEEHIPKVTMRVKIKHPSREKINIRTGVSEDPNATDPTLTQTYRAYSYGLGGDLPMQGINDDPIEIELDVTKLLVGIIPANKFFLEVTEKDPENQYYDGEILDFTLVHYNTNDTIEIPFTGDLPTPIENNDTTLLAIEYDYPDTIPEHITLFGDIYLKSEVTIPQGVTVTIANNCKIHFKEEGRIIVDSGAVVNIQKNVRFTRQQETNTITVAGEVEMNGYCNSEVEFIINNGGKLMINEDGRFNIKKGVIVGSDGNLTINKSSTITLNSETAVIVESGGNLVIHNCAVLEQNENAIIVVEENGILSIHPYAILDVAGHCAFEIAPGAIIPPEYVDSYDVVPPTYTITVSDAEWIDKDYRMVRQLEILPHAYLKLENVNLRFINTIIIVRPQGLLKINRSVLTSEYFPPCMPDPSWFGIQVEGDPNSPQIFAYQGAVILQDSVLIEKAYTAVKSGHRIEKAGGIIQSTDVTFRNNNQDVFFYPYQNLYGGEELDNISYFKNCTFETDDNIIGDYINHVELTGVKGIDFTNCTIADNRENISYLEMRKGIYSLSSSFQVSECNFENLSYGIYATTSDPEKSFRAVDSEFSSHRGIYFNGMDNVRIMDNVFDLHDKPSGSYGVYIDHANNFQIENNNFYSDDHITRSRFGILANNTGALYKEIYRNDFDGFTVGIEAIGINKGSEPYEGLELRCNRFDNNAYDIFVTDRGIRELQGYPPEGEPCNETLAGNLFGNESQCLIKNFLNEGEFIYYHHHDSLSESRIIPELYNEGPIRLVNYDDYEYDYYTSCPIREENEPMSGLFAGKESSWLQYEETSDKLKKLVDDGNTELMVQLVEMTTTPNAYQNYQTLMATSPYLSEKVLTTLSAKEEGFSKAMVRDVLVENPQAAKSKEVNNALDNRKDPLPEYMREQINKGLHYFGEMELLRFQKAYHKTQHDKALNRIISSIVHEDKGWENAPCITTILSDVDDMNYRYLLAEFLFAESDYTQGFEVLSSIETNYNLNENELIVHNDYLSFYAFLKKWDNEKHPAFTNLPEEALIELETFIGSGNRIAGKALSLLMINDAIEYEEPIIYPAKQTGPKTEPHTPQPSDFVAGKDEPFHFNLFPNPCKNYITLSWCSDTEMRGQGIIEIRNSQGVLMHSMKVTGYCDQQIISLYDWKSGSYTATIRWANYRKTLPFIVLR